MDNSRDDDARTHPACKVACEQAKRQHPEKDSISARLVVEEAERYLVIVYLSHSTSKLMPQPVALYAVGKDLDSARPVSFDEARKHGFFTKPRK